MTKFEEEWLWTDWFVFALRLCWYITGLIYFYVYPDTLPGLPYSYFVGMVTLCYFIPQFFWRPGYINRTLYPIAELICTGSFVFYTNIILGLYMPTSVILMPVLMIGYLATKKTAVWALPIFLILIPGLRFWSAENLFMFFIQYIDIFIFFGFGLNFNIIIRSQQKAKRLLKENVRQYEQIQEQNKVLEKYARQVEELTLVGERNRLARELHDSIGHHYTSVTVGLDAVSYMMDRAPEQAKQKIEQLAHVARQGLDEIRKNIHQIAPAEEDKPLSKHLEVIAKEFSNHTETEVQFTCLGDERPVSPSIKLAIIRCFQEAITNAKRHGHATKIVARCGFHSDRLELTIENNGLPLTEHKPGFGLRGMEERLAELQGSLTIENSRDGEVRLTATIPLKGVFNL